MQDDTFLITKTLAGDDRAFADLVDKYQSRVFNFVLYTLRNREDADEVVQDTFLKAYRSLDSFRNEARFSTWLLRIAYFGCLTKVRRKKTTVVDIAGNENQLTDNNVVRNTDLGDMQAVLSLALSHLPDEEKGMVTLYYYNELSIREICEVTGKTDSNVKVILHRSRKKLLKVLNEMGIAAWTM